MRAASNSRLWLAVVLLPAAALLGGALLSKPLHLLLATLGDVPFHKAASVAAILSGLSVCFLFLRSTGPMNLAGAGLDAGAAEWKVQLPCALVAGVALVLLLECGLLAFGVHAVEYDQGITRFSIAEKIVEGLLAGLLVALIEETMFRGALFTGLQRLGGATAALVVTSTIYAAAHYIKYPPVPEPAGWLDGFRILPRAFYRFSDPGIIDAFLCLFVLGLLFGLMRIARGNIVQCIGFHAGLVCALRLASYVTEHRPDGPWEFMVNRYDHQLGWFALLCVSVALIAYGSLTRLMPARGAARAAAGS